MNTLMKRTNGNNAPAAGFSGMVDRIFQDNLNRFFNDDFWGFNGLDRTVGVPVNIRQTAKSYELEVLAPGLKKEDLKVTADGNILTISFEQQKEDTAEGEGWLRKEYRTRSFSRSFTIDDTVDVSKISASYQQGILHLDLPKKQEAQALTRTIEIK